MLEHETATQIAQRLLNRSLSIIGNEFDVVQTDEQRVVHEMEVVSLCEYVLKINQQESK